MKRIISTLFVAAALLCSLPAAAQVKFGLTGGLNLTKLSTSGKTFSSDNRAGWFIGPKVQFNLPVINVGIDGALLYSQRQMNLGESENDMARNRQYKSVEIPINVRYTLGLGQLLGIYAATGPQFGFNVGNRNIMTDLWTTEGRQSYKFKDAQVSWNVGVGLVVLDHLQVGAGYNFQVGKTGKYNVLDHDGRLVTSRRLRSNSWQVQATYLF